MNPGKQSSRQTPASPNGQSVRRKLAVVTLLVLICALYLGHVRAYDFVSDDTFITLRYAENLAEGHGLVFNHNDRIEGFSSPLWTIVLSAAHWVGLDLLPTSRTLGTLIGLAVLVLLYLLVSAASDHEVHPLIAAIAPLVLASNGSFACWAASGMETMLYMALLVVSFLATFSGKLRLAALSTMALILARPESAIAVAVLGLFLLLRRREYGWKRIALWGIACCGTTVALFASRYLYYGQWLPNTFYAKTGGGLEAIGRGLVYLRHYAADHEGLVLMSLPLIYAAVAGNAKQRCLALAATGLWLFTVVVGGDGLPMYRFAVAPLALLVVLQAQLVAGLYRAAAQSSVRRWVLHAACIVAVLLLATVHATKPSMAAHYAHYEYQKHVEVPRWTQVGTWLRDHARPGESLAAVPIGAVSYYSGLTAIDMLGLTDGHIAHREMPNMGEGLAGHEKHDGPYILSRKPTYLLLGNIDVSDRARDPSKIPFIPYHYRAIWEREKDFYDTDLLPKLYESRSAEIVPGVFLNFYELREQYRTHGLLPQTGAGH